MTKPVEKNALKYQEYLEEQLEDVVAKDTTKKYYERANEIVSTLLEKSKEISHHDKKSPFSCIYGVILSGCVQKQLAVPNMSCGYLVFLYYLKEKHLDNSEMDSHQKKHKDILSWIKQSVDKIRKELCTNKIKILKHSKSSLKIKWKGLEYHIAIAWTFSKRQYCAFHYTQDNVHVYPFSLEQLQMAANDLIDEAPIHHKRIKNVGKANKKWRTFLEHNLCASLSLLRVYYMREELVGRNTRLAVLFLKIWQHVVMKDRPQQQQQQQCLSNNSLEIICAHLLEQLEKTCQPDVAVPALDIIHAFFKLMARFLRRTGDSANEIVVLIEWPHRDGQSECLVTTREINRYKSKVDSEEFVVVDNLIIR
ncbi:hypothetical protein RFI_32555 [Reticulomyxa filosa]|uniref:Uncharacterized protein n=1 Tax=Reticulomyxa filosa TaxID=46433 RepID=X6LUN8_RETFI|nr:hypothetical protein RFI_32555 [Reticulomyxa filosa]|eukprot:ETO04842.1 hypothetical protein RFI_32555 [Reticulomyxa filosa]